MLLDSFAPDDRSVVLDHAARHGAATWILRLNKPSPWAAADAKHLHTIGAQRVATLPAKSLVLHDSQCWSAAKWDQLRSPFDSQLWLICPRSVRPSICPTPCSVQALLGQWTAPRYDFYCPPALSATPRLQRYRACQQDALFYAGTGMFGGTDGSVHRAQETMGAGAAVSMGTDPTPILELSVPVGGPLSTVRAEAVALLLLLTNLRQQHPPVGRLTLFIDCLCLLQFLSRWGRANFWPGPKEIPHFDVLLPLLRILREWTTVLVLVKVKSHAGCYHNKLADVRADAGRMSEVPLACDGPQKYGTLHLRVLPSVLEDVRKEHIRVSLPQDRAPNKSIIKKMVQINTLRATYLRETIFVRDLVRPEEGSTVARLIYRCNDSAIRCWIQAMTGSYPVATYLHRIGRTTSKQCQHCTSGQDETLSHFLSVCPKFHDARTAAHNQIRVNLSTSLQASLPGEWTLYEETPMRDIRHLQLRRVPSIQVKQSGRDVSAADEASGSMSLGNWRPDFVAVSRARRKIAILDVCRPSDSRLARLSAAYQDKVRTYQPLLAALGQYSDNGWTVQILPWVVGARGLIQQRTLCNALDFLEICKDNWQPILNGSVQAAISALLFMHSVRFATARISNDSNPRVPPALRSEPIPVHKTKRKASTSSYDFGTILDRWRTMAASSRRR